MTRTRRGDQITKARNSEGMAVMWTTEEDERSCVSPIIGTYRRLYDELFVVRWYTFDVLVMMRMPYA
jgi:hypothetical protein